MERTIGQIAAEAGVAASAIRYYEREGLLPPPERVSGQRRYGEDTLGRLEVIGVAKRAGFSLDDVRVLLHASDAGEPAHAQLRALAERKLPEVEALIARAEAMRDWLVTARGCSCSSLDLCGLFDGEARSRDLVERSGRSNTSTQRRGPSRQRDMRL
jgi:MerR family transcriptional regulator, redox-sensitive transcriptional activator SoxR